MTDVSNTETVAPETTTEAAPEVNTEAKVDSVIENPEVVPTPAEPVVSEGSAPEAPASEEAPAGETPAA